MPQLFLGSLTGRLPTAAAPLAIVLCTVASGGNYGQAGTFAALYGLAATLGQPLLGRLVDRNGQRGPMLSAALISTTGLAAFPVAVHANALAGSLAAAVGGLATPPLESALRSLLPRVVPAHALPSAFALDVVTQSAMFAAGPLLVTAVTGYLTPAAALATAAVLGLAGTWAMIRTPPSRNWHPAPHPSDWLGPLRSPAIRGLTAVLALVGIAIGAQSVAGAAWAEKSHHPATAGLLLAAFSVGSCAGGLAYSRHTWHCSAAERVQRLLAGFLLAWLPLTLSPDNTAAMVTFAVLPGLLLSPILSTVFTSLPPLVEPAVLTEANGWMIAAVGAGSAIGTATAGALADHHSPAALYLTAATAASLAAAYAALRNPIPSDRADARTSRPHRP
ncbi:MFS transporter [Kitasatospora sp. GP82]|uniref:MFS transporter n=1 Tax=Kitasatospora sp. GP82 TaxID=3035089 RepID=UPI002476F0BC|nr:MFS transporter [Kitasatospora sp. GP82]